MSSAHCFEGSWLLHVWNQAVGLLDALGEGAVQNTGNYSPNTTVPHFKNFRSHIKIASHKLPVYLPARTFTVTCFETTYKTTQLIPWTEYNDNDEGVCDRNLSHCTCIIASWYEGITGASSRWSGWS